MWGNDNKEKELKQELEELKLQLEEIKRLTTNTVKTEQADEEHPIISLTEEKELLLQQKEKELSKKEELLILKEKEIKERESLLSAQSTARNTAGAEPESGNTTVTADRLTEIQTSLIKLEKLLQENAYKDKIIKDLHEEIQKSNHDISSELIKPLLKNIIKIHEGLTKTYHYFCKQESGEEDGLFKQMHKSLESHCIMIQDMLEDEYDLIYYCPEPGNPYSPKEHYALRSEPTDKKEDAGNIIECIYGGFKDQNSNKVLKSAIVAVFKSDK